MAMANSLIQGLLKLLLENVAFAGIGDVSGLQGSATAGDFWFALHSADPLPAGTQATSEVSYTGYSRVNLARATGSFTLSGNVFSLAAPLLFGQCTAGSATAAYASIGTASSGAGTLLWTGPISPSLSIASPVIPELTSGTNFTMV